MLTRAVFMCFNQNYNENSNIVKYYQNKKNFLFEYTVY